MRAFFLKILSTPKNTIPVGELAENQDEVLEIGTKLKRKINRLFKGSLAIRQVDAGSDNSTELELVALGNQYYDVERFGIHFVASPRHADMLMVTGPVARNMAEALRRAYEATPDPKIVVAVGDDAIDGGIFKGSYAVLDGVESVIPVHYKIPGNPPSPRTILLALLQILDAIDTKIDDKSVSNSSNSSTKSVSKSKSDTKIEDAAR
jgi:Ni,Fe-hydrogenase III small subunit